MIAARLLTLALSTPEAPPPEIPPRAEQVAAAVLAAPEELRAGARVLAYGEDGDLEVARDGDNHLVCLADDPKKEGFHVACYHRELEPYMARGRELRAEGLRGMANREKRWAEIDAGELEMPKAPRALYALHGETYDPETKAITERYLRWVIFTPYATEKSTGLSPKASPGAPWIMFPGTAGAHIMINPPKE
jgi:hypothetical protein